nr:putative integron gene cassette protein [uncultured bacterium]
MNSALEFHDSTVASVQVRDGVLRVIFSAAYVHRSLGRPGLDAGGGFSQSVEISFKSARITGNPSDCQGNLSDGLLVAPGYRSGLVPIPFDSPGPIEAELTFTSGALLRVESEAVSCVALGDPVFIEKFRA